MRCERSADRIPLLDARFFVTAVQTQREMGGNLSEVLDKLSAVIRERFKVKRQVRAVSAHGRITGVGAGLLPPAVAGVLFMLSPEHIRLLVDDPLGVYMVVAAAVLQVVGVFCAIRKIVDVDFDVTANSRSRSSECSSPSRSAPAAPPGGGSRGRRRSSVRLRNVAQSAAIRHRAGRRVLAMGPDPAFVKLSRLLPKSPKEMSRLQRDDPRGIPELSRAIILCGR